MPRYKVIYHRTLSEVFDVEAANAEDARVQGAELGYARDSKDLAWLGEHTEAIEFTPEMQKQLEEDATKLGHLLGKCFVDFIRHEMRTPSLLHQSVKIEELKEEKKDGKDK